MPSLFEAVEVDFDATGRILGGISTTAVVQTPTPLARMVNMTTSNEQLVEALKSRRAELTDQSLTSEC